MMVSITRPKGPQRPLLAHRLTLLGLGLFGLGVATLAHAGVQYRVSQKGRAFAPAMLAVQNGDSIEFVNDDGELLHHAYLESEQYSFDTGDQAPGSRTLIAFPKKGSFTVLCGIHPKMKLSVQVR